MPLTIATVVALTMMQMQIGLAHGKALPRALDPQPLSTALEAFSKQTGLQVVYSNDIVRGIDTHGVKAGLSAEQALRELLRDTGLTYELVNERTIAIVSATSSPEQTSNRWESNRLRVAQATENETSAASSVGPSAPAARERIALEEVLVTGSNIRGVEIQTAPMTIYTRHDIERTGYTTVQQLIESIPQNFGGDAGGVSEDGMIGAGSASATNAESATAMNLRGLGPGATLVLINGHRVAPSANAAAVDVSVIPLAAIERVEVLTDGSSAIYGSEAIAGVVNFILREDYEGAETSASYGTAQGVQEKTIGQMAGHAWDTGNVLFGVQYQHRDALAAQERSFTSRVPRPTDVMPRRNQTNFLLTAKQALPAGFDAFGQALYTRLDVDRMYAARGGQFMSSAADTSNRNFSLGVGYEPFADWRFEVSGLHARQFTDFNGTASPVGYFGPLVFTRDYELNSIDAKADGTLFQLRSGNVKLALGGSYRDESYDVLPANRHSARNVRSAYAELSLPLVGASQSVPMVHQLALSAAARYDDYSDFGDTTNPRVGVMWSPWRGLELRSAYSTSFRAPNANELDLANRAGSRQVVPYPFAAPDGNGTVPTLLIIGASSLQPEESRSWTYGFSYVPARLQGLKITLDYYDIEHTNRIAQPPLALNALQHPDIYSAVTDRYSSDAQVQATVDMLQAAGYLYRDYFNLGLSGIRYGYDYRLQNLAKVLQRGFDLGVRYRFDIDSNGFELGLQAARVNEILTSLGGTRQTDLVDTIANPLELRVRANLAWSRGPWSVSTGVNYSGSYADTTVTPNVPIDDWLTIDLTARLSYDETSGPPLLRNTSFGLSVSNLFDEDPPGIVGSGFYPAGYDVANASPLGRFIALSMKKGW